jgi:hypothetical protein
MKLFGPYLRHRDSRLILIGKFVDQNGKKRSTTFSYPKWLMEQHLGRKLVEPETVDHVDGNPLNNEFSNLRIVTRSENASLAIKPASKVLLQCKYCQQLFERRAAVHAKNVFKRKTDGPFCSKRCVGKVHH